MALLKGGAGQRNRVATFRIDFSFRRMCGCGSRICELASAIMQSYAGLLDASSVGAAAGVQVIEGFLDQPIKSTCRIISGDLAIP